MEKITKSKFGKFENHKVSLPQLIVGGQLTGGGMKGSPATGYVIWDEDDYTDGTLRISDDNMTYISHDTYVSILNGGHLC